MTQQALLFTVSPERIKQMPLYEYRCESCKEITEAIQKFSDPPLTECPKCHGPLRKLLSAPAIQFKGSGFYINDYAKGGSKGGGSDSGGSDSGGSDSGKAAGGSGS